MTRLTTPQAAARLGMTRQGVLRAIKAGRLPATKLGRDWTVEEDDLAAMAAPARTGRPRKGTTMPTATLSTDLRATQIHGQTGQQVVDATLPAGTTVAIEPQVGPELASVLVEGYRYRVRADRLRAAIA